MAKSTNLERKAQKLIIDAGEEGLLQSGLWKSLGVSSREGSRIALKFVEKERVERKKVLSNGRWTYRLFSLQEPVTLASVVGCPCLICDNMDKCFRGGVQDPVFCLNLTAWIDPRISNQLQDNSG